MRSSNYIKFVTRCCWASLSYCINIDARPEISQCIYFLTTPDCLVAWNMVWGGWLDLHQMQKRTEQFTQVVFKTWWVIFVQHVGTKLLVCGVRLEMIQLWLDCHPVNHFIQYSPKLQSLLLCSSTKLSIPVMSCRICLSLIFSVSLTLSLFHNLFPTTCTK